MVPLRLQSCEISSIDSKMLSTGRSAPREAAAHGRSQQQICIFRLEVGWHLPIKAPPEAPASFDRFVRIPFWIKELAAPRWNAARNPEPLNEKSRFARLCDLVNASFCRDDVEK